MKTNQEQREDIQRKIEYYDTFLRKEYNLHRARLTGYTFTEKYIKFSYQDNEATINLKLKI